MVDTGWNQKLDGPRISRQRDAIRFAMADYRWRTLRELAHTTGHPEASISARLRDLRKPKFGGFEVEKKGDPWGAKGAWRGSS